jgi:hypothetical protein
MRAGVAAVVRTMNPGLFNFEVRFVAAPSASAPAVVHRLEVKAVPSEREAMRRAFLSAFGGLNRKVHKLGGISVCKVP